jgi:hypothetical protein
VTYIAGQIVNASTPTAGNTPFSTAVSQGQTSAGAAIVVLQCAGQLVPIYGNIINGLICGFDLVQLYNNCGGGMGGYGGGKGGPKGGSSGKLGGSLDPNDKFGSSGSGKARYLTGKEPLRYQIDFTNEATATAPAQRVVVTDALDASKVDLSTFSLGPINFGSTVVAPPEVGQTQFSTTVDLRPAQDLLVDVSASLNMTTGLLTVTLQAIDPATGIAPNDPSIGFLPPDVKPPEGEGSLFYTVKAKAGLRTGTVISNGAVVYFDNNAPIATPTWTNTLDNTPPTSTLKPLKPVLSTAQIKLKPVGKDVGSGVLDYNIYVREDGGPFQLLVSREPGPKIEFTGVTGHRYRFFSQAIDAAGNVEPMKDAAEARTRILGPDLIGAWKGDVTAKLNGKNREKLKGTFSVVNQSPTRPTTAGSFVRFYLAKTDKLDDQDKVIGQDEPFGILPPNGSVSVKLHDAELPAGATASGKYLIAVVDPDDSVEETDYTNNTAVYGPLP